MVLVHKQLFPLVNISCNKQYVTTSIEIIVIVSNICVIYYSNKFVVQ